MSSCIAWHCLVAILCYITLVCPHLASASCKKQPCFPSTWDLTTVPEANVSANSTCGLSETETYCVNTKCDYVCDSTSNSHGAKLIADDFTRTTYWKSKNKDENVVLQLDLGHSYFFTGVFVTFQFEYPASMYIAKSNDYGKNWKILAYFSTDCSRFFKMTPVADDKNLNGFKVQCFKINTLGLQPGQDLKVSFAPWRDSSFSSNIITNHTLQQEYLATNFRVVLVNFITPAGYDPGTSDARNYYFTIRDWQIDGHCYCSGHSDKCDEKERWKCNCLGNTIGENCEKCLPLFNNASYEEGKACQGCNCGNHSSSCVFSGTKGYGVCQNCTGYTTGDTCEKCLPKYYNSGLPFEHLGRCQACNCHLSGTTNGSNNEVCDQTSGQCDCKSNVTGRVCNQCKDNFWNLKKDNPNGCQGCECESAGTVNGSNICDKTTGQCPCQKGLGGRRCTKCADGYYGLTVRNPLPCKECNCDLVGSKNETCDQDTGDCFCRNNYYNSNCSQLKNGNYVPGILDMTYQPDGDILIYNDTTGFVAVRISGTSPEVTSRTVTYNANVPKKAIYTLVIRYKTATNWGNVTLKIESLSNPFQPYQCGPRGLIHNQSFTLTQRLTSHSQGVLNFGDSCLAKGQYKLSIVFPLFNTRSITGSTIDVGTLSVVPSPVNLKSPDASNETWVAYRKFMSSWLISNDDATPLKRLLSFASDGGKDCSCNDTGSSNTTWCDPSGGQCVCRPNVMGRNCDSCKPTFYNFTDNGCQACNCNQLGSKDLRCDEFTGKCRCKPGVIGQYCDQCELNYYGFNTGNGCKQCRCSLNYSTNLQCNEDGVCSCLPGISDQRCEKGCNDTSFNLTSKGCQPCNCNIHGSASLTCDKIAGNCSCKVMAVGQKCDSCPSGYLGDHYYGLNQYHPTGCLKCDCSGKTINCSSKPNMYETYIEADLGPKSNRSVDLDGWRTTSDESNLEIGYGYYDRVMRGEMRLTIKNDADAYYSASDSFLGDKLRSYQHAMTFYLWLNNDSKPYSSTEGDVILTGKWFNKPLVYKFDRRPNTKKTMFRVFFGEQSWTVGNTSGPQASSYELRSVLGHLTSLKIRGRWTKSTKDVTYFLSMVKMYYSKIYNNTLVPAGARMTKSVEKCFCPSNYTGDSCQNCDRGFTRKDPKTGPRTTCVLCSCSGNSEICDPDTGICRDCKYNTSGNHCEKCAPRYYGNALLSSPDACQPCSCFGGHQLCYLIANESFNCECGAGYKGRQCESCSTGHWGTPTEPNGTCRKCECNGNSDICHKATGDCSATCQYNTTGINCEWCERGFWGDATSNVKEQKCQICNCSKLGSKHEVCNNETGQCECRQNVQGRTCSNCSTNYWGFESGTGCTFCNCSKYGAVKQQCNLTTGNCSCKDYSRGSMCDQCPAGKYDVSKGCLDCECNMTYSLNTICNTYSGQCECKRSSEGGRYGGRQCTQCAWDAVGTFPSCAQCNETCYSNWYKLIDDERNKVTIVDQNITDLLKTFNESTTVEKINEVLAELNKNLKDAEEVFTGARYTTKEKEEQFNLIKETMVNLTRQLYEANQTLTNISWYLNTIAAPFDGTVNITSETPPVLVNSSTILDWARKILHDMMSYNQSGYQNYQNITSDYEEIKRYNESGREVVKQIERAMNDLDEIRNKTNEINAMLNREFYRNVEDNNVKLKQLETESEEISRLVDDSSALSKEATRKMDYAVGNLTEAEHITNKNLEESGLVYNRALTAKRNASTAVNVSKEFLTNSTTVLKTVEDAIADVNKSISDMALARVNVENATTISKEVLAMTIPVKNTTISDLSAAILKIPINESLVNATLKDATSRLKMAEESQRLSQQARDIANETLFEVMEIERKIQLAQDYQTNTTKLLNATDNMVKEIEQTTSKIKSEFSAALKVGNETLDLLDTAIKDVNEELNCFNESHNMAINATNIAELAYKNIMNASKIINQSNTDFKNIEQELKSSHQVALDSYRDVNETNANAIKLLKDIKEAEDLLKSLINQQDEMDIMEKEITQFEKTLEEVNNDLDAKLSDYQSCGGN